MRLILAHDYIAASGEIPYADVKISELRDGGNWLIEGNPDEILKHLLFVWNSTPPKFKYRKRIIRGAIAQLVCDVDIEFYEAHVGDIPER